MAAAVWAGLIIVLKLTHHPDDISAILTSLMSRESNSELAKFSRTGQDAECILWDPGTARAGSVILQIEFDGNSCELALGGSTENVDRWPRVDLG